MRKETCFSLNRGILLATVAGSILIPILKLSLFQTPVHVEMIPDFSSSYVHIVNLPVDPPSNSVYQPEIIENKGNELFVQLAGLLKYIYLTGILFSLILFIRNILLIVKLIGKSTIIKSDGYRLAITEKDIPSFAFCHSIIISRKDYDTYGLAILSHEKAHIRMNHFYDLILLELVKAFHWFNPAVYGLIRDLKEIHEYQADDYTLNSGVDITQYQLLLIKKSVGPKEFALANSFNHCQIKKRIAMINKQKNNKTWRWKVIIFLPVLIFLLMAFSKTSENKPESSKNEIVNGHIAAVSKISQVQQISTDWIIQIKREGNYIDNKLCTLEEIALWDQEWRNAHNKPILLLIDESIPYHRIDEVREALDHGYGIVQSTVGFDELVFFHGDVSRLAEFKQGTWKEWAESELLKSVPDLYSRLGDGPVPFCFIVDKNGKVRDAHIIKGCDDAQLIAVFEETFGRMPDWEPAKKGNESVNVYYEFTYRAE